MNASHPEHRHALDNDHQQNAAFLNGEPSGLTAYKCVIQEEINEERAEPWLRILWSGPPAAMEAIIETKVGREPFSEPYSTPSGRRAPL